MGNFALPWAGCSREDPHVVPWLSAGAGDPPAAPTPRPQPGLRSLSFEQPAPGDKLPAPATGSFPLFIPHLWLFLPREDPGIAVLFGAVCRTPCARHRGQTALMGAPRCCPWGSWIRAARQKSCPCSSVVLRGREGKEGRRLGTRRKELGASVLHRGLRGRSLGCLSRCWPRSCLSMEQNRRGWQGRGDASEDELWRMSHAKASLRQFGSQQEGKQQLPCSLGPRGKPGASWAELLSRPHGSRSGAAARALRWSRPELRGSNVSW